MIKGSPLLRKNPYYVYKQTASLTKISKTPPGVSQEIERKGRRKARKKEKERKDGKKGKKKRSMLLSACLHLSRF